MNTTLIVGRITQIGRMTSSKNDNPRFRVTIDGYGQFPTQPDASIAYAIENPEYRGREVKIHLNGRGHIVHVEIPEGGQ